MRIETREDGIKEIFLEEEHEVEHLLGKFITKDDYDLIIDFSCDVYKPNKKIGVDPRDESLVLMKFRKGVFSEDLLKTAYDGLEKGAGATQNRGLAAGPELALLGPWYALARCCVHVQLKSGGHRTSGRGQIQAFRAFSAPDRRNDAVGGS